MIPISISPAEDGDINGIIRLSKEYPSFESSELTSSNDYRFVFNESSSIQLCSANKSNSYFIFKFPKRYLLITNYTVASNPSWGRAANHAKSWLVDGLFRGRWKRLGFVEDSKLITDIRHTFAVDKIIPISGVRFTMIGPSTKGTLYHFCVHKLDFFGAFIGRSSLYNYCYECKAKCLKSIPWSTFFNYILLFATWNM